MVAINQKTILKSISILGFLTAFHMTPVMANEHEADCAKHIQNKVAWDSSGHTKWETNNITKLCNGTTVAKEPGECFDKVMNGHVKWGEGDKWEWENALRLCSGTNDSDQTISCFQKQIHAGTTWNEAILQCQVKGSKFKSRNYVDMK